MLDRDVCYRALQSRDARFDGRFFTGVVTTRIYCRPVCPAPTPKSQNVQFFHCAAAAQVAGFRPCRRCRPEASPGTPAWIGSSANLSRALRLIAEGALDEADLPALALRLGLGERQLRRLFSKHLGASPIAVARTQRVHFAKTLIDDTSLPMTRVAYHAGFKSVRHFNTVIRATFGRSPRELRQGRGCPLVARDGDLTIRLPYRPPFDWPWMIRFLRERAVLGVELVEENSYRRSIVVGGLATTLEVRPLAGTSHLLLIVPPLPTQNLLSVVERARRLFDLGADPQTIGVQLRSDPRLRPLIARNPGLRVPGAWDGFELMIRAILGQQISVKAASTLAGRLAREFGAPFEDRAGRSNPLTHLFPRPEVLANAPLERIGLPSNRAHTIRMVSQAVVERKLVLEACAGMDDAAKRLCEFPGIGPWTAQYIGMRAFREPDAFPSSDLGIRKALAYGTRPPSAAELEAIADRWRPWRAYATMYLWTSLETYHFNKRTNKNDPVQHI